MRIDTDITRRDLVKGVLQILAYFTGICAFVAALVAILWIGSASGVPM